MGSAKAYIETMNDDEKDLFNKMCYLSGLVHEKFVDVIRELAEEVTGVKKDSMMLDIILNTLCQVHAKNIAYILDASNLKKDKLFNSTNSIIQEMVNHLEISTNSTFN